MKNLKTNWLIKHALTVFSCVLIIVFGIAFLSQADPVTTTIGENIATNDLSVTGNVTSGTWQGDLVATEYGGTGADWSAVAQGNLPYFSAEGVLSNLAPGTAGQFLKSQGTSADPKWANVTRSATFVVAANDSSTLSKQQADYVCDGVDDQVEIQAAIDALPSGGGKVVLMEGEYSKGNVTEISISSNTEIEMNPGVTIKLIDDVGDNPYIFKANSVSNVKISGGVLDGNKSGQTTTSGIAAMGISFVNVTDSLITGVTIKDIGTSQPLSGYGIYFYNSEHNIVTECIVDGSKRENIVVYSGSDGNIISNNIFLNAEDRHIVSHSSDYNIITDNVLNVSGGEGMDIYHDSGTSYGIEISGNTIIAPVGYGIYLNDIENSIVSNNIIKTPTTAGIYLLNVGNSVVSENIMSDGVAEGILLDLTEHSSIINNQIINFEKSGIYTSSTAHHILISGNQISNSASVSGYGIRSVGNYHIIDNNQIFGGSYSGGIYSSGNYSNIIANSVYNCDGGGIECKGNYANIVSNVVIDNYGSGIAISDASYVSVSLNQLSNNGELGSGYDNGVTILTGSDHIIVSGSHGEAGTHQTNGIRVHAGTTNILLHNNDVTGMGVSTGITDTSGIATINNNIGYTTESSGTATLANTTTSIVVTHGLDVTPSAGDITITPIEAWGTMTEFYIDTYTSTQFTIHADQDPTQDVDFAWKAIVL